MGFPGCSVSAIFRFLVTTGFKAVVCLVSSHMMPAVSLAKEDKMERERFLLRECFLLKNHLACYQCCMSSMHLDLEGKSGFMD